MVVTFYDLASKDSIGTWAPNPWKTRYLLNYKKLPYKMVYLEYTELGSVLKGLGIPPVQRGASLDYTCPSITDDTTGAAVSDSYRIAEYLDKQYPDTPKAFPPGSEALQAAFYYQLYPMVMAAFPLILGKIPRLLNPVSQEHFRRTRETSFGKPLEQVCPIGKELEETFKQLQGAFDLLDAWYGKSGGPYFMGDTPSFADFAVGGVLESIKIMGGEDSEEWEKITSWNDGRWLKLVTDLKQYASMDQ